ncbi:hypothetical protein TELCIR_21824 [Teladorsagia circumcincta]|uniref:Uncharacterized protein n=1 Tax=Teladorsagia circumcincta TaxID=45464 RepID=A0A2G9TFP4_TELCI|nr:hypothetical protein TELCIR_21824 [Teladorsagia circumcincta]
MISEGCDLSDISEEDAIELCGPYDEGDNYDDIKTDTVMLTEESGHFQYARPDEEGLESAKKYTLEEMENLFNEFEEVLIF